MGSRTEKFKLKLDGEAQGRLFDAMKAVMVKHHGKYQIEAVRVEEEVRTVLCEPNVLELPYYIIFGKEILKVLRKHKARTAEREINILMQKWCDRGLHPINLYKVLTLFYGMVCKVKVWDGTDEATVTPEGWLDVKTHTPDKCFANDFAAAQIDQVIITPAAGKRIELISVYTSVGANATNVTLKFKNSGNTVFKLHTIKKSDATGNIICAKGDVDEEITLTSPEQCFISIGYDEVD